MPPIELLTIGVPGISVKLVPSMLFLFFEEDDLEEILRFFGEENSFDWLTSLLSSSITSVSFDDPVSELSSESFSIKLSILPLASLDGSSISVFSAIISSDVSSVLFIFRPTTLF